MPFLLLRLWCFIPRIPPLPCAPMFTPSINQCLRWLVDLSLLPAFNLHLWVHHVRLICQLIRLYRPFQVHHLLFHLLLVQFKLSCLPPWLTDVANPMLLFQLLEFQFCHQLRTGCTFSLIYDPSTSQPTVSVPSHLNSKVRITDFHQWFRKWNEFLVVFINFRPHFHAQLIQSRSTIIRCAATIIRLIG